MVDAKLYAWVSGKLQDGTVYEYLTINAGVKMLDGLRQAVEDQAIEDANLRGIFGRGSNLYFNPNTTKEGRAAIAKRKHEALVASLVAAGLTKEMAEKILAKK